ncbi:MAG: chlorite dismutase family protein [Acidimicrobiales bacterium]
MIAAVKAMEADDHQVVTVAMLGHKADVAFMAIGPDIGRVRRFQSDVATAHFEAVDSYVSLTEVSEYAQEVPEAMKQARLYPRLPPKGKRAWCFYPMTKRRDVDQNWYLLPYDQRKTLMLEHGQTGKLFHRRILQLVTGSTGLDDWEWGVTLFAVTPNDLKECVHRMRFDEVSARYAEFGPFYTGVITPIEELVAELPVAPT